MTNYQTRENVKKAIRIYASELNLAGYTARSIQDSIVTIATDMVIEIEHSELK